MADERDDTERSHDPTLKHLDEALQRGDVAKSQEVNTWFVIAGMTLIVMAFAGSTSASIMTALRGLIAHSHEIDVDGAGFLTLIERVGRGIIGTIAIPLLLLALAAVGGNLVQH